MTISNGIMKGLSLAFSLLGLSIFILSLFNVFTYFHNGLLIFSLGFILLGVLTYCKYLYGGKLAGIKNNFVWQKSESNRGIIGIIVSIILTGFYVCLYWYPEVLGKSDIQNTGLIRLFDPLSLALKNKVASEWFVYGVLYTFAILVFGIKFIIKYRHNRYQVLRTISVIFFQLIFAFLLPEFMLRMNLPYNDLKNMWPLNYYFFDQWNINNFFDAGSIGKAMFYFGLFLIFIGSPLLTYFYGKRWYCSWVCGCGGLAETAGDSFRHLSSKSLTSWRLERILIYSILLLVIVMTFGVIYSYKTGSQYLFFIDTTSLRSWYGFLIGAAFSGVIGVGFYPILGSRVWCRFGCPMAAILGIQQKYFSRFRITTNGGQCISCGNCSTYCEMGIDVRAYAQRGENILRASCVGCGICSEVCPRGVLKLENGSTDITEGRRSNKLSFVNESEVKLIQLK